LSWRNLDIDRPDNASTSGLIVIHWRNGLRDAPADQEISVLAVVETEFKIVKVPIQVLHADLMERTDNRPLEQTERAFDAVGVHVEHQNDGS
jgi:hypothetical protein